MIGEKSSTPIAANRQRFGLPGGLPWGLGASCTQLLSKIRRLGTRCGSGRRERLARRGNRAFYLGLVVSGRNEHRLELRRGQIDPALEHRLEKPSEFLRIGPARIFRVSHRFNADEWRQE